MAGWTFYAPNLSDAKLDLLVLALENHKRCLALEVEIFPERREAVRAQIKETEDLRLDLLNRTL